MNPALCAPKPCDPASSCAPPLPFEAVDFPIVAFPVLSMSATLPPFHTCGEWSLTPTDNKQRRHQRRPYGLLVYVLLFARCPSTRPARHTSAPGPAFSHLQEGKSICSLPSFLQGERGGGTAQASSFQPIWICRPHWVCLISGTAVTSLSPAAWAGQLFLSLDQIRDHDLLIAINIA